MNKQKKDKLLRNLREDTYCRIGVSKIAGVGIIAVRDIPKGVNPFKIASMNCPKYEAIKLTKKEVDSLPAGAKKLVKDFIYKEKDGSYNVPQKGMNALDISFYMNHSKNPNVDIVETECDFMEFRTNREIKAGEELVIRYDDFD